MTPARLFIVACLFVVGNAAPAADEARTFDRDVKPFLQQFCIRCHNVDKQTSGVRVDNLDSRMEDRHLKLWSHVVEQAKSGGMPPEDALQPTTEQRRRAVAAMELALKSARLRPTPKNGSIRRLTVAQYRNTLRDLLLLDEDLTTTLPPDAVSKDGFVNNRETLQISPLLLEAYLGIAEQALDRCIVDPKSKPVLQTFRMRLGEGINPHPIPDRLILGADSLLLENRDFVVEQLRPDKPFAFEPFAMRTKYRFIEGYQGNDTVRGWRDYDSLYHAVFACMRGPKGYPKGTAFSIVPEGLLLRPSIPSSEVFGQESTYGPRANFKIALRELPDHGRFRVTVTAAKYDDALLLDPGAKAVASKDSVSIRQLDKPQTIVLPRSGAYQVELQFAKDAELHELTLSLGGRRFSGTPTQPAFLVVRLPAGPLTVAVGGSVPERAVFTPLEADDEKAKRFATFEKRSPRLGVHLGLRRDCGSALSPIGEPQVVADLKPTKFVFEGAIRNFPDPSVEKDNANYLAGIREIGVRSEETDGRDRPRLLLQEVEFEGPLYDAWPPVHHRNLLPSADETPAAARTALRDFATRAFRRPVTSQEEMTFVDAFERAVAGGAKFHEAVKSSMVVILTSPQFLFLIEKSESSAAEPLDDFELASKLSYFLWNGPPDDRLLKLAATRELTKCVDAEVSRMIADPKFRRFVDEFAGQWLSLDKFAVLEPDRQRFPRLAPAARAQLRNEPARFLEHLILNDLPARNLIASDFIVANEVAASYYGLAAETESGFAFTPIRTERHDLGGLLTQPAILAGLSDGREPNPVKRGAWLARKIIAEPPDDPPPNVPALKDDGKKRSLRERLALHRSQPGCMQCHSKIDPWGVPFEQYDADGLFRTSKVDGRSTLPDRTDVADFAALRRYLAEDRIDQVAFSPLKHLTIYAVGRELTFSELEFLHTDARRLRADGYRMQALLRYVVHSPMFREK